MAPIKSSLARTVAKLLGVHRDSDLSLRGQQQSTRFLQEIFSASGGTKSTFGDYTIHVFTSDQNFVVDKGSASIDVLLVGGGGSGGVDNGGGGGGGGVVEANVDVSKGSSYPIVIGAGGAPRPGPYNCGAGKAGESSTAFGLTAQGGGAGTGWGPSCTGPHGNPVDWEPPNGGSPTRYSGGSGGGQSSDPSVENTQVFTYGSPGTQPAQNPSVSNVNAINQFGTNGGHAWQHSYGGGGGGAGGAGGDTGGGKTGIGGLGAGPWTPKYGPGIGYDDGTPGGGGHFGGGGTGGWDIAGPPSVGSPDSTSRNGVTKQTSQSAETACAANTGAGGHGANHNDQNSGGGGSGICVVKYLTAGAGSYSSGSFSATGGSKITSGDYTYHVWTTDSPTAPSNNFDVSSGQRRIDIMLVAGGGGGGANNSGGGGAGGMVYGEGILTADPTWSSIPVSVGAGGNGGSGPPSESPGSLGGDTTFGSSPNPYYLIAKAGGASGQWTQGNTNAPGGGDGGSGAGGPGNPTSSPNAYPLASASSQNSQPGNSGIYAFANKGGNGVYTGTDGGGGGGGGAGGQGFPSPNPSGQSPGGIGGAGKATVFPGPVISPAVPSPQQSAFQTAVGPTGLYGGGGGGGAGGPSPANGGTGGTGGGGTGGAAATSTAGSPGVYGTGGGGGGGDNTAGGAGGSGILIIRYLT